MKRYFQMTTAGQEADIVIYGDITSWVWDESDVSSYTLARALKDLDVDTVNVYINSYGGEVKEGLAIYNELKRHKAKVRTVCDGFACSAASVIFMAGDERVMNPASLLMVHNAWTFAEGNADQLRKEADDLETITQASINAYMAAVSITEEKLKSLLDEETWILPADALEMGFATAIEGASAAAQPTQSVRKNILAALTAKPAQEPAPTKEPEGPKDPPPQQNTVETFLDKLSAI